MKVVEMLSKLLFRKQKNISGVKACGHDSDMKIIDSIRYGGPVHALHYRELKLLLQDCEQARAAYPHLSFEALTEGRWFLLDKDTFPLWPKNMQKNFGSSREVRSLMPVVRSQFSERASSEATALYLEKEKQQKYEERIRTLKENGPSFSRGDLAVSYNKIWMEVIVTNTPFQTSIGTIWEFPFILEEWFSLDVFVTLETIKNLPSFQQARKSFIKIKPRIPGFFSSSPENAFAQMRKESEEIEQREFSLREKLGLTAV